MKSRDRVLKAIRCEPTDRVPMQMAFTPEFAERLRGDLSLEGKVSGNPHSAEAAYDLEIALGVDILRTSVGWVNSYYRGNEAYTDEWGVRFVPAEYTTRFGTGYYTEPVGHPLADAKALESYVVPDPERPELYTGVERLLCEHGNEHWIVGETVTTILETAGALRGLPQLLMDLVEDPGLADRILEIPFRYHLAAAKRMVRMGVDMIWVGDDVGTQRGLLLSPRLWRKHLKPRMARFIAEIKSINPALLVAYHSDGDIRPIIPELIEIGIDVLNPIQPRCMDPAEIKRDYGDRLAIWGTIDEQYTLPFGTPDDVRREVCLRLETVGMGGGFIIGPTHHLQLDTPLENFWAMVETITGQPRPSGPGAQVLKELQLGPHGGYSYRPSMFAIPERNSLP
jgi:uroporphyrinogen decarboxylase